MTALTLAELERARRELAASLALARPGSPVCVPIQAQLTAIGAELTRIRRYLKTVPKWVSLWRTNCRCIAEIRPGACK